MKKLPYGLESSTDERSPDEVAWQRRRATLRGAPVLLALTCLRSAVRITESSESPNISEGSKLSSVSDICRLSRDIALPFVLLRLRFVVRVRV